MQRMLIVGGALLLGALSFAVLWAGEMLTVPARSRNFASTAVAGSTSLVFESRSGVKLSARFLPGIRSAGAVLLLHGVRSSKESMLPRARFLHARGFSILVVDLQAHGESGGERISFGGREAADVDASVARLRMLAPGERIGVLGVSLGGAAILLSNVHDQIQGVVLESVYPTINEAVANRLRMRFGTVGAWAAPLLVMQLRPRLGLGAEDLRPIGQASKLRSPVLVVHGTEDRHTTLAEAERLYAALREPKEFYVLPGAAHVDLHAFGGRDYEHRIGRFLELALRSVP